MEDNENVVVETTENADITAEEIGLVDTSKKQEEKETKTDNKKEEMYTSEQVDDILAKRIKRLENKIKKEYENKNKSLEELENVVKTGLKTDDIATATSTLKEFYKEQGVEIPENNINKKYYNEQEEMILAKAEVDEIISANDVDNEIKSLENTTKLTTREKFVLEQLKEFKRDNENLKELKKIGAEEYIEDKEFLKFKENFNKDVPIKDIFSMFEKINNKTHETIGSMQNNIVDNDNDYITEDEYKKLKSTDFEKPNIMQKIKNSIKKGILTP